MERITRLLAKLKSDSLPLEDLTRQVWPLAVGKIIAGHTQYASLVRRTLVIEVEDAIWRKQLTSITPDILRKIATLIGPGLVTDLEFRVAPLRMRPRKERPLPLFDSGDEAQRIADPIFRRLYTADRQRRTSNAA
ncbi:MAG: DUF721 domain-containing protein [Bryobacteraceae bacterium]|nr:DUF721 domain-containing protein [Bryobacteraceae bacterium]